MLLTWDLIEQPEVTETVIWPSEQMPLSKHLVSHNLLVRSLEILENWFCISISSKSLQHK